MTRYLFATAVALATWLAPPRASAVDFCVQTDAQFNTALTLTTLAPNTYRILLGAGKTFHLAGSPLDTGYTPDFKPRGNLFIEGGYNADCSAVSTYDAASTVLDGTGSDDVVINAVNDFTLSTLTVSNLYANFLVLNWDPDTGTEGMRVRLLHTRFLDGSLVRLQLSHIADAQIHVENSVFARLSGLPPGGGENVAGALAVSVSDGASAYLIGNTITRNNRNGLWTIGEPIYAYDNISYRNNLVNGAFHDWSVFDAGDLTYAAYNIVGSFNGSYALGSHDNSSSDPLFVSATDFNLQLASPARESGTSTVPGGLSAHDVEGGDRVVGAIDRGAFEANSSGSTVLLVTNTNDSGTGSLRAAITDANANPAFNIIGFNIPGACPRTIALNTELPAIADAVSIRGYTQPGSAPNTSSLLDNATICVELTEASGHTITNGLHFTPAADDDSLEVSGLAIGGFNVGIDIDHGSVGTGVAYSLWGNFIGLAADGSTLRANSAIGIDVGGRVYGTIGGDDNARRNVIAGSLIGVRVIAEQSNFITNNYIGTSATGSSARSNTLGVALLSGVNQVLDNVISGNTGTGVSVVGTNGAINTIAGNRIGLKAFSLSGSALGNGQYGISVAAGAYGTQIRNNTIAYNGNGSGDAGIRIDGTGTIQNHITANSIYDNAGLGIDLGTSGVDTIDNDATVDPNAPNRSLNRPFLYQSSGGDHSGSVVGRLNSIDDPYRIEFFASPACDASGYGQGRYFVGSLDVTISGSPSGQNGQIEFVAPIQSTQDLSGMAITAVAIDRNGSTDRYGNTSEFGNCVAHQFIDVIFADGFENTGEGG